MYYNIRDNNDFPCCSMQYARIWLWHFDCTVFVRHCNKNALWHIKIFRIWTILDTVHVQYVYEVPCNHCTNLAETFMISQVWLEENDLWLESSLLVTIDILLNYPSWTNNNVWKSFFSLQMFLFQVSLIQTVYSNRLLFFLITLWDLEKAYCFSEWNLMCCSAVLKNWRSPPETTTNQFQVVKKLWRKLDFDHKRLA